MPWIVLFTGLVILWWVSRSARLPSVSKSLAVDLEDALPSHLTAIAERIETRGRMRISISRTLLSSLENSLFSLLSYQEDKRFPAARHLCCSGRFLQEEAARILLQKSDIPKLPRAKRGMPRLTVFAHELISHCAAHLDAHLLDEAIAAWQSVSPMTVEELNALPFLLSTELLSLLCNLAHACAVDQQASAAGEELYSALQHHHTRKAKRLFAKFSHNSAFQERLFSLDESNEWLQTFWRHNGLKADSFIHQEHERQMQLSQRISSAIESLRSLRLIPWDTACEKWSVLHKALKKDPVYENMDLQSRALYRTHISRIAHAAHIDEQAVLSCALTLCQNAQENAPEDHVGYYLLDDGLTLLARQLPKPSLSLRMYLIKKRHACDVFRLFSWIVFALSLYAGWILQLPIPICLPFAMVAGFTLQQLALLMAKTPSCTMPRMKLDHLTEDTRTLVVCPVLLYDAKQALRVVRHLSVMHEANPDKHLHFLLLGDFQDSLSGTLSTDADILLTASSAVEALCEDTGHPFFYLQRERFHAPGDAMHRGRERRRGMVQTLLQLVEGRPISDSFAYTSIDPASLKGLYRYVITLDADVFLPPESALHLVGAMLHPLAKRQKYKHRMRGVSMIQPRMESMMHNQKSHLSSALAATSSIRRAFAEQRWTGRGRFEGNGIIDPGAFLDATERTIPDGVILLPHLLEGELGGCRLSEDIVLYEETPQTLKAFLSSLHRRTRANWQLLSVVCPFVPAIHRPALHSLDTTGRFQIWRSLFISLLPAARLILLAYAAAAGHGWLWLIASLIPGLCSLRRPMQFSWKSLLYRLSVLPCETFVATDAIVRTIYRLWFSHQHLLDWTSDYRRPHPTHNPVMLFFTVNMGAAGLFALFLLLPAASFICCVIPSVLWGGFVLALPFLEQQRNPAQRPTRYMREVLLRLAQHTLTCFETALPEAGPALIPSHVQIDPNKGIAPWTTPEDIAWYMSSLLASEKLRLMTVSEMAEHIKSSLLALESLPLWHGLPYHRYDIQTLQPLDSNIFSSECGLLAVSLLTCAQGLRSHLEELRKEDQSLPMRMDDWVRRMELSRLYDAETELFRVFYNPAENVLSQEHHDMLASESRLLSFVSIMLHQIPMKHWRRLNRQQTRSRALISHSGAMSEYLTPVIYQPLVNGTLLSSSAHAVEHTQRRHRLGDAFGISQSAYYAFDTDLRYLFGHFGLPALAVNPQTGTNVLAPYASLLSMQVNLKKSFRNLLRLQMLSLEGPLGLFEAADFDPSRTQGERMRIVRSHFTRHQGMILCSICNVLENGYMASLFSHLPRAEAYCMLAEELPMQKRSPIRRVLKQPSPERNHHLEQMTREAQALHFPIDAHLLSGAGTVWLIDAQGGGCLKQDGLPITRFSESCHLPSGMRLYLRDSQSGAYWTVTDPYLTQSVRFESAQAVFTHTRFDVSCETRMWVNPLDGSAILCLTLENTTSAERMMEVCSYLELDTQQPAKTERMGKSAVSATFMPDGAESSRSLWHMMQSDIDWTMVRLQSDRDAFLGRGRTFHAPRALEFPLSAVADSLGVVTHPCISLRGQFILPPVGKATFFFVTHLAQLQEKSTSFLEKYASCHSIADTYEPALTRGMVCARFLNLTLDEQVLISRMTGILSWKNQPFQGGESVLPISELSRFAIEGQLPLLLLECCGSVNGTLLSLLLKAYALYHLNGFPIQLAICAESHSSIQKLVNEIEHTITSGHCQNCDGIHIIQQPQEEERLLLRAQARLVLSCSASLEEQLSALTVNVRARPLFACQSASVWQMKLPASEDVLFFNGYGGFTPEKNYQITLAPGVQTPHTWCNPLYNPYFCTFAGESGPGTSCCHRCSDEWRSLSAEENFYLRDSHNRLIWSLTRRPVGHGMPVRVTYAPGEAVYECSAFGIYARVHCFTDHENPLGIRIFHLKNDDQTERALTLIHSCLFPVSIQSASSLLYGYDPQQAGFLALTSIDPETSIRTVTSAGAFHGLWSNTPYALSSQEKFPNGRGCMGLLTHSVVLHPGESLIITTAIGLGQTLEELQHMMERLKKQGASQRLHLLRQSWQDRLGRLQFDLPDQMLSILLNRWLPYQSQMGLLGFPFPEGSNASHQALLSLAYTHPQEVRSRLGTHALHMPEKPDEMLAFLYALASYVEISDDRSLFEEQTDMPSLLQRCLHAIDSIRLGAHDLPMKDNETFESVELAMLLCETLRKWAALVPEAEGNQLRKRRENLLAAIERHAWDGAWYLQGWNHDGQKTGSRACESCRMDLNVQSWAVLCGVSRDRCAIAMENVWQMLYDREAGIVRQFIPCPESMPHSVQKTCLCACAFHQLGQDERAWELALHLLPTVRSATRQLAARYRLEPFALSRAVYALPPLRGRGTQPWDGESAGWYLHMMIQQLLGLRKRGDTLRFCPVVPPKWDTLGITYLYGSATYHLHASRDCLACMADGQALEDGVLTLADDGRIHEAFFPLR